MRIQETISLGKLTKRLCEKIILIVLISIAFFNLTIYAQKAELIVQTGHSDNVYSVEFSPDGKFLASGGSDGIKLWDVNNRQELRTLKGHKNITEITFSTDGKYLASSGNNILKVWDITTGQELQTFSGHTSIVESVAFKADGKIIASGSRDGDIKLWNVSSGMLLQTFKAHTGMVYKVLFSPNQETLASCGIDNTIKILQ